MRKRQSVRFYSMYSGLITAFNYIWINLFSLILETIITLNQLALYIGLAVAINIVLFMLPAFYLQYMLTLNTDDQSDTTIFAGFNPSNMYWWLSLMSCIGTICLLIGAIMLASLGYSDLVWVQLPFLFGSIFLLVSSFLAFGEWENLKSKTSFLLGSILFTLGSIFAIPNFQHLSAYYMAGGFFLFVGSMILICTNPKVGVRHPSHYDYDAPI